MNVPARKLPLEPEHPLLRDRARLEVLVKKMLSRISSIMCIPNGDLRRGLSSGETAEDVLQQTLIELLQKPADYAANWEGLGMQIARRRAVDAVRRAVKGRQLPSADGDGEKNGLQTEIDIVSLDAEATLASLEKMQRTGRLLTEMTPEDEYLEAERQEILWDLARETLNDRDLLIYRGIHHHGLTPPAVATLTGVALGERQVRNRIAEIERRLVAAAAMDPRFPNRPGGTSHQHEGDVS